MEPLNLNLDRMNGGSQASKSGYSEAKFLSILERFLNDSVSIADAAAEILAGLPDRTEPLRYGEIEAFSAFLIEIAEQIPYTDARQSKMVNLVQAVSISPQLIEEGSRPNGSKTYHAMPNFKHLLKNHQLPDFLFENEAPDMKEVRYDLNRTAFIARLYQRGVLAHSDYSFALNLLSEALEIKFDYYKGASDMMINLGASWIIFAGQSTYVDVVEAPPVLGVSLNDETKQGRHYSGPLLGLERWTFWKQALQTAMEDEKACEETRTLSKKAAELMELIERNTRS